MSLGTKGFDMRWIALLSIVLTSAVQAAVATAPAPASAPAPATAPAAPADAIRLAATPSAAVEAYARAVAAAGVTDQLQRDFVRRMIDLGVPELAEAQAQDLIRRGVPDGLSLGVVAYVAAARGEMSTAIEQLKLALMSAPDDFLLRTAGQIVAWYDTLEDRSALTAADKQSLEWIRNNAKDKPAFADAYRVAASTPQTMTTAQAEAEPVYEEPRIYIAPYEPYPTRTYVYSYPIITNPFFCKPHHGRFHHHGSFVHHGKFHHDNRFHRSPFVGPLPHADHRGGLHRSHRRGGFVIGGGLHDHREPDVVSTLRGNAPPQRSIQIAPARRSQMTPRHDPSDRTSTFGVPGGRAGAAAARSSPQPSRFGTHRGSSAHDHGGHGRSGNVTSSLRGR